ncbi:DUF4148 domain-containing protein [Methylibium petroleiphilum]|jgi:hypothetical protein|uniref:DUF4148 domain-containing protein n=1 Tax=Methylibium petroleiphilum (strain ATCC BAA-1232 / LMG 22953 / PM1) TaxID=420662 RepID=A2SGA1_METPP|nr:DUF4148 domain-containing protein [Methylibium petroleiphilum]ABM94590.1 hypothetical protein Mpe_A1628 [Methylibium petroleiphilum PM1]
MSIIKSLALVAVAAALAAPGMASATAPWHAPVGDGDATFHPEYSKSTRTRAEVIQELEAARKDGSLWYLNHGLPVPVKNPGPGKSRAEVIQELDAARKDGSLWYLERGLPVPVKNSGPGRTREEVRNEVLNLTLEEKLQFRMIGRR